MRPAQKSDIKDIMMIIEATQAQFKLEGLDQWQKGYPNTDTIDRDIQNGNAYVLEEDGAVLAYLYCAVEKDDAYGMIRFGKWLNDDPYAVIHRLVVDPKQRKQGLAVRLMEAVELMLQQSNVSNIRIDTHPNNKAMLSLLEKSQFTYCGQVLVVDGMRYAFQKIIA